MMHLTISELSIIFYPSFPEVSCFLLLSTYFYDYLLEELQVGNYKHNVRKVLYLMLTHRKQFGIKCPIASIFQHFASGVYCS